MTSASEYEDLARAHLPQPLADRWISLLRPAIEFPYEDGSEGNDAEGIALRIGSDPSLPEAMAWPEAPGYGPLMFMAEMDCAAVAAAGGVESLPTSGHLLFFFGGHPDRYPDHWSSEDGVARQAWEQGQVVYVADGTPRGPRPFPEPDPDDWLEPIEELELPARQVSTPPSANVELIEHNFGAETKQQLDEYWALTRNGLISPPGVSFPLWEKDFEHGVTNDWGFCQTGGHVHDAQRPVVLETARMALDSGWRDLDDRVLAEAEHWRLLLQIPWDEGDMVLYWLIRDDDLVAGRFDRIWFGIQR